MINIGSRSEDTDLDRKELNICQDVVYVKSKGKKLMPKDVGIGLTTHHATRSKRLQGLLHAVGCSISYDDVRRIETTIAESAISAFQKYGVVIPNKLVPGRFV